MPGDTIAIPTAMAVQPIISAIPRGKVTTAALLARIIATKSNATVGCSVTTGICAWIIANAAHDEPHSFADVVPWWRVVKPSGELNAQYPGGVLRQKSLLEEENVAVFHRRGRSFVHRDYVIAELT